MYIATASGIVLTISAVQQGDSKQIFMVSVIKIGENTTFNAVADPGRGPGDPGPHIFFFGKSALQKSLYNEPGNSFETDHFFSMFSKRCVFREKSSFFCNPFQSFKSVERPKYKIHIKY